MSLLILNSGMVNNPGICIKDMGSTFACVCEKCQNEFINIANKYLNDMKIIAIDFDGVIHDIEHPLPGRRMGAPITGAREALLELADNLNKIIIFTVRANTEQGVRVVANFMNYYYLPYNEITNIKPVANIYIDDKGVRFTNWSDILKLL